MRYRTPRTIFSCDIAKQYLASGEFAYYRRQLAAALDERLMAALRGPRWSSSVPVVREQIAEASGTLLSLAQVLRASESVHSRGVAMVFGLLSDGDSPFYIWTASDALDRQARVALDCLVGQPWAWSAGLCPLEGVSH
jgi:hypothetical protein